MNRVKMKFMQNAPSFVFITAICFAFFVVLVSVVMVVTGDKSGLFFIALILGGIATVFYAIKVFSRGCDKPFLQVMQEHRESWAENDNG